MKQVNIFNKGGISDVDRSLVENDRFVFPTLNIRLTNHKEKGFIPSSIDGNELAFDLDDLNLGECKIWGFVENNGILYMAISSDTYSTIACYPSPKWIQYKTVTPPNSQWMVDDSEPNEFVSLVKPIVTISESNPLYDGGRGLVLSGSNDILKFNRHVEMIARPSYDGSVDLYLCDYSNDNKVINTCFNQSAELLLDRLIPSVSLKQMYSHILYASSQPKIDLFSITSGGRLKPGSYFLAARYLDKNFNRTVFSPISLPFLIANDSDNSPTKNSVGLQEKNWLTNVEERTNRQLKVTISNLDTSMPMFEIAVIRYSSIEENAIPVPQVYLIDKYYDIITPSKEVTLNGMEKERLLSIEELTEIENHFRASKSHNQIQDRYIGVNWKSIKNSSVEAKVKDFALSCTVSFDVDAVNDVSFDTLNANPKSAYQYNINENIREIGYFLDEVYPFGLYVQFKSGYKTDIYPLTGTEGNEKGLLWLSSDNLTTNYYSGVLHAVISGHDFTIIDDLADEIDSINIVRGDRIENLLYSGILYPVFNKCFVDGNDRYFKSELDNENDSYYIPLDYNLILSSSPIIAIQFIIETSEINFYDALDLIEANSGELVIYEYTESGSTHSGVMEWTGSEWVSYSVSTGDVYKVGELNYYVFVQNDTSWMSYSQTTLLSGLLPIAEKDGESFNYLLGLARANTLKRLALFSPDFTVERLLEASSGYLKTYYRINRDRHETFYNTSPGYYCTSLHSNGQTKTINKSDSSVSCYPVLRTTDKADGRFTSMLKDGLTYDKDNGAAISFDETPTHKHYNRSVYSVDYIGIEFPSEFTIEEYVQYLVNQASLFYINPEDHFNNLKNTFSVETTQYKTVHVWDGVSDINVWGGDCFNQLSYIRMLRWFGADSNTHTGLEGTNGVFYQHGHLLGFNSQNKYNFQLRNEVPVNSEFGVIRYGFFPKIRETEGAEGWVYFNQHPRYNFEGLQVNKGYGVTLPSFGRFGFDVYRKDIKSYVNRVFISSKHTSSSYVDGYRKILLSDYRDYEIGKGAVVGVFDVLGQTCLVQTNQIIQIVIDERAVQQSEMQNMLLAKSGDVLSEQVRPLSDYGAFDVTHIVQTEIGLIGVDVKRKILWRTYLERSDRGYTYLAAVNLGESLGIQNEIDKLFDVHPKRTDITGITFNDSENKLVMGYDNKHGEIHITVNSVRDYMIGDYEILSVNDGALPPPPPPPPPLMVTINATPNNTSYGMVSGSGEYDPGAIVVLTAIAGQNYTFMGWYENDVLVSVGSVYQFTANSDRELIAVFGIDLVTITYVAQYGGSIIGQAIQNISINTYTSPVSVQPLQSHNFTGWNDGVTASQRSDLATENITYTAAFSVKTFTVNFINWDGTFLKTEVVSYGQNATPPTATREGYVFTSWNGSYTNITSNVNLVALFEIMTFTVTFEDYDGTVLKTEIVDYDGSATAPPNPTREGYDFIGWDITFSNVVSDLTVVALYEEINGPDPEDYTLGFRTYANTLYINLYFAEGEVITLPPNPPMGEGYSFESWFPPLPETMPANNLTTRANRLTDGLPVYTFTWKDWDDSVIASIQVSEGASVVHDIPDPVRDGYNFINWIGDAKNIVTENRSTKARYEIDSPFPSIWNEPIVNELAHGFIILLTANPRVNGVPLVEGDWIAGFYIDHEGNKKCGGARIWTGDENRTLTLFGNEGDTDPIKDGFYGGEIVELRFFIVSTQQEYVVTDVTYDVIPGYASNGKWAPTSLSRILDISSNE